jgi:catechol 2,3-dioxygenase-like lactoylglutathione lyase family enzyme
MAATSMKPRLNFVTLGVSDVKRAKAFYKRLGLTESSMGNEHVGFFDINGVVLAVFGHEALAHDAKLEATPPPAFRGVSLAWNTTSPAEVDAILEHAVAAGAKLVKTAEKVFWGGYSGYFSDPDGHLWEVAHNPYVTITKEGHIKLP